MLIGILQTGHAPDGLRAALGDYDRHFERLLAGRGFTFRSWNVVDMDFPAGPEDAEGWLITGSRHGAYEDLPFIAPLEALIRAIRAAGRPLVGICFGHQIVATALGGKVEKFPGGWAVGPTAYDFDGETLTLHAWHQDQVTTPPPGARTIARNDFCTHAAMAIDDSILTVQAHPEYGPETIRALIDTRGRGVVPDALLDAARAGLGRHDDNDRLAAKIAAFFHERQPA